MNGKPILVSMPLVAMLLAGCADDQGGRVSLALTTVRPIPAAASRAAFDAPAGSANVVTVGDSTVITMGNDTVVLRSIDVVLREVELKRVEAAGCDDIRGNDDCEEFETGAMLVEIPLGTAATATVVTVTAPAGIYDELEFEVHKPDALQDAAFIAAHPTFDGVSIRVSGTYSQAGTRSDFTFTSDLNAKQEILLSPPLTVSDGQSTNVTMRLDVASWFLNAAADALVNPATANKGQQNENVVRDRIQASIDAFRDDDRDGHDDDHAGT